MKRLPWLAIITAAALTGCATNVMPFSSPNVKRGVHISCNGFGEPSEKCYAAASEACAGPYDVVSSHRISRPTGLGPHVTQILVVACKG
jgi:hypothetical protein